jgi:hypothetical protein
MLRCCSIDELRRGELGRRDLDAVLVHGGAGAAHLLDECEQRAAEAHDIVKAHALQERDARGQECLGGRVRIDDAVILGEHENGMRQRGQQQVVLDGAAALGLLAGDGGPAHAAASRASS